VATNTASAAIHLERAIRAWDLRQRGWSQRRIAGELSISQGTVSRLLDAIERRELARLSKRVERQKVEQTYQLDHIIDEALDAWERSKKPRVKTGKRSGGGKLGTGESTVSEVIQREGEPAFLDRALGALDRKRSLWGLDAPKARPKDEESGLSVSAIAARLQQADAAYDAEPDPTPTPPEETADGPDGMLPGAADRGDGPGD
jgi:predicted transcriptional regulator